MDEKQAMEAELGTIIGRQADLKTANDLSLLAEQIAINERLHHPEDVLHKLKSSPLWS